MLLNDILFVLGLNLGTQFIVFICNVLKSSQDSPELFKLITYFSIFSINIIIFCIFASSQSKLTQLITIIYAILTVIIFIMHFFLDIDELFRFDKIVVVSIMFMMTVILYSVFTAFFYS